MGSMCSTDISVKDDDCDGKETEVKVIQCHQLEKKCVYLYHLRMFNIGSDLTIISTAS